jgi:hypothetical protein
VSRSFVKTFVFLVFFYFSVLCTELLTGQLIFVIEDIADFLDLNFAIIVVAISLALAGLA